MADILSPNTIYDFLDDRVVGQEDAKRTMAAAGFLHASKTLYWRKTPKNTPSIRSSNVLLMGPSGCGKTYLVQNTAEYLGMPYLEINSRSLSNEGYKGLALSDHFEKFYYETPATRRHNLSHAVVFFDEFDKLCVGTGGSPGWDASLQHSLLKALEGGTINFPDKKGSISTKNMMFVLGGNFEHLRNNLRTPKSIGYNPPPPEKLNMHTELIRSGVIQEVAGRISLIAEVTQLTKKDLKRALTLADQSIYQQYQDLYSEIFDKDLELSPYHINKILEICMAKKIGARGLHASLDEYLAEHLFEEKINLSDHDPHLDNT